jgi:formate--tetrahydrofolate ligase
MIAAERLGATQAQVLKYANSGDTTGVQFEPAAAKKLEVFTQRGYGHLPVCIAKTQASITDDPEVLGAPRDWTLTVRDAGLFAGAGFVVAVTGEMMLMPGLGKSPQAVRLDVDDRTGAIQGMI